MSRENISQDELAWHAMSVEEVFERISSSKQGLSGQQAAQRLDVYGPNKLGTVKKQNLIIRFLLQFHNVLIYVLLGAVLVTALLQEWVDSVVIFGVCVINALIGFFQEGKAEKSMESIRGMLAPEALAGFFGTLVQFNILFAVFNLLPIPPLDGSKIIASLLPLHLETIFWKYERYGYMLLLVLAVSGIIGKLITPIYGFILQGLLRFVYLFF